MTNTITYGTYRRKSEESSERQILSLEDQEKDIEAIISKESLKVAKRYPGESKSAYKRGRPIFTAMMKDVEKGLIQGIVVWHPNRLARNAFDGGWLITAMDEGKLLEIKTPARTYKNNGDDKFFLQLEFGMAKKSSDDSSTAVKRGLKSKLEDGWMPGTAPLGYENTKLATRGANKIVKDELRFNLIRKAWELMLTGTYSPDDILDILNNEWGFRTREWIKKGSKPMSRSTIYRIFSNPFYAGLIAYQIGGSKGVDKRDFVLRPGKHEPMVTLDEYDKVQILLGDKGKPRNSRHEYAYTGTINCEVCGGYISATYKEKLLKSTGEIKRYVLYYCVDARKNPDSCSQGFYTNVEVMEEVIEKRLSNIEIIPEFLTWALKVLEEEKSTVRDTVTEAQSNREATLQATKKQLDNLLNLRIQELVDDDEFNTKRTELKNQIARLEVEVSESASNAVDWIELTAQTFEFALYAHSKFLKGDSKVRRQLLCDFGLNQRLFDGLLSIEAMEWFIPIENDYPPLEARIKAFEPALYGTDEWEKTAFAVFNPEVRGLVDAIGTRIRQHYSYPTS